MALPRPCITPGCRGFTSRTRCSLCERQHQHRRNASPKRRAYSDPVYRSIPLGGPCYLCGLPGVDTRDHVIPLSRGGTNAPENIRLAHRACNSARRDRV